MKIVKMVYEVTINGRCFSVNKQSVQIAKSAIQKYARRGMIKEGLATLYHFDNVLYHIENNIYPKDWKVVGDHDEMHKYAQRYRTNIANRLLVIGSEDINIYGGCNFPNIVFDLYTKWSNNRTERDSTTTLMLLYCILANSAKGRLLSYLKSVYTLPPYYVAEREKSEYDKFYNIEIRGYYKDLYVNPSECIDFADAMTKGIKYAFCYISLYPQELTKHFKSLIKYSSSNDKIHKAISSLFAIFKKMTHAEKPLYFYHAVCLVLYSDKIDYTEVTLDCFNEDIKETQKSDFKNEHSRFVYDMHTKKTKGIQDFVSLVESFKVNKERVDYSVKEYEAIYWTVKMWIAGVRFPIKRFDSTTLDSLPHAQKRCGKHKRVVWIDVVGKKAIKGPYQCEKNRSLHLNLQRTRGLMLMEMYSKYRTAWPWSAILVDGSNIYLEAPLVTDNTSAMQVEISSTKIEENVPIIRRGTLAKRASELELGGKTQLKEAILQHLDYRWRLQAGDAGLHNILLVEGQGKKQLIAGNDLEETRNESKTDDAHRRLFKTWSKATEAEFLDVPLPSLPQDNIMYVVNKMLLIDAIQIE